MGFLSNLVNATPGVGTIKAVYHYARGEEEEGDEALYQSTRTTAVIAGGVFGGPAGAMGAGVATDAAASALMKKEKGVIESCKKIDEDIKAKRNPTGSIVSASLQLGFDALSGCGGSSAGVSNASRRAVGKSMQMGGEQVIQKSVRISSAEVAKMVARKSSESAAQRAFLTSAHIGLTAAQRTELEKRERREREWREKERRERERRERERRERERREREQREREWEESEWSEEEQIEREWMEREEREREWGESGWLEEEQIEREWMEREQRERDWMEQEWREREWMEREQRERDWIEQEWREREWMEREQRERDWIEQEWREREWMEREQRERDWIEQEWREREWMEREQRERDWIEQECREREWREREWREQEQREREQQRERKQQKSKKQEEYNKKEQRANSEKQKRDTSGLNSESSQPPQDNEDNNKKHKAKKEPTFFEAFMALLRRILKIVYGTDSEPFSSIFEKLPKKQREYLSKVLKPIIDSGTLEAVIELVIRLFKQHFDQDISYLNFLSLLEFVQTYVTDELQERTLISSGTETAETKMKPKERRAKIISEIASEKDIVEKLIELFEKLKTEIEAENAKWNTVFPNFRDIFAAVYHYFKHRKLPHDGRILSVQEYYDWIKKFLVDLKQSQRITELRNSTDRNYVHEIFVPQFRRRFKIVLKRYDDNIKLSSALVVNVMHPDDKEKHAIVIVAEIFTILFTAISLLFILQNVLFYAPMLLLNTLLIIFNSIAFIVKLVLNTLLFFFACFIFILKVLLNILLIFTLLWFIFFYFPDQR